MTARRPAASAPLRLFAILAICGLGLAAIRGLHLGDDVSALLIARAAAAPDDDAGYGEEDQEDKKDASEADADTPEKSGDPSQEECPAAPRRSLADRAGLSREELAILASLSERRDALEAQAAELTVRESLVTAAEARLQERADELKSLQTEIERLLGQREAAEQARVDGLVALYQSMKPKDAARILPGLDEEIRLAVASSMKERSLADILALMPSEDAVALTMLLARRGQSAADLEEAGG